MLRISPVQLVIFTSHLTGTCAWFSRKHKRAWKAMRRQELQLSLFHGQAPPHALDDPCHCAGSSQGRQPWPVCSNYHLRSSPRNVSKDSPWSRSSMKPALLPKRWAPLHAPLNSGHLGACVKPWEWMGPGFADHTQASAFCHSSRSPTLPGVS